MALGFRENSWKMPRRQKGKGLGVQSCRQEMCLSTSSATYQLVWPQTSSLTLLNLSFLWLYNRDDSSFHCWNIELAPNKQLIKFMPSSQGPELGLPWCNSVLFPEATVQVCCLAVSRPYFPAASQSLVRGSSGRGGGRERREEYMALECSNLGQEEVSKAT